MAFLNNILRPAFSAGRTVAKGNPTGTLPAAPSSIFPGLSGSPQKIAAAAAATNRMTSQYTPPAAWTPTSTTPTTVTPTSVDVSPDPSPSLSGDTGGGGLPDLNTIDYSNDPILIQVKALQQQRIAEAEASALASRKQELVKYGDPAVARKLLGDEATAQAAQNNPFGIVEELGRWNDQSNLGIDEGRNKQNLFYSSTRARDRSLQGEDYLRQTAAEQSNLDARMGAITAQLLAERRASEDAILQAQMDAFNRALARAGSSRVSAPSAPAPRASDGSVAQPTYAMNNPYDITTQPIAQSVWNGSQGLPDLYGTGMTSQDWVTAAAQAAAEQERRQRELAASLFG